MLGRLSRSLRERRVFPKQISRISSSSKSTMSSSQAGPGPSSLRNLRPPSRPDMKVLDKSAFDIELPILAVKVKAEDMSRVRSQLRAQQCLLDIPKTKMVVPTPEDSEYKLLRLRFEQENELPEEALKTIREETGGLVQDTLVLDYDHWQSSEILAAVLPVEQIDDVPSGFTTTGHIAHMNLRDEWLPYRNLIGQVILDKNRNLRTVVNKLNTIHAEYRYFDMEVLAGDKDFITTVSESGCLFTFDFSLVYWNSRLHSEHERIINTLEPDEVVVDVMAGVGPFAVPAAKKGCSVFGNDLNPESVKWMEVNRVKNKVEDKLRVSEIDGHTFIKTAPTLAWETPFKPFVPRPTAKEERAARKERERLQAETKARAQSEAQGQADDSQAASATATTPNPVSVKVSATALPKLPGHYIMNLPDSALTFLPSFRSSFTPLKSVDSFNTAYPDLGEVPMPLIHVYCFTREMEFAGAQIDILKRATGHLGAEITPNTDGYGLHLVRSVAPNKEMYCLTFRLPRDVAFGPE